jgi:hypothetical protein
MTAQTIMATARHVKQVAAASRSLASPSANRSEGCKLSARILRSERSQKTRLELGLLATVDSRGRTILVADAHRDDGRRFIVHADEKLSAFVELESAIRGHCELA